MSEFQYLDYNGVQNRLDKLISNPECLIKQEEPLGYTDFNLPINHYTLGHGSKHIVVTGAQHSAEIITTIFVVRLMEELAFDFDAINLEEYTIDFIPMLNPEGYLITTSMQNLYLDKGKTEEEKIALAKDYWRIYREDAINTAKANKVLNNEDATPEEKEEALGVLRGKKGYQALYDDVNLANFLSEYPKLRKHVLDIVRKNNYPIGVCAAWTANGHGIDLMQNTPFNSFIKKYRESEEPYYGGTVYTNIRKDVPGPINSICRDLEHFRFEKENTYLLKFLTSIEKSGEKVEAFLNYHGVMGKMYQIPNREARVEEVYNIDIGTKLIENYTASKSLREGNAYDILESYGTFNFINEYFRLRFGINVLIELSRMGSNPIGPLGDPETFENVTVKPNIEAFKKFVKNLEFTKEYAKLINNLVFLLNERRAIEGKDKYTEVEIYRLIDKICATNPSVYAKLREEVRSHKSFADAHVMDYLYNLIETKILEATKEKESDRIKAVVVDGGTPENLFEINYSLFISKIIKKANEKRKVSVSDEQVRNIIDNICIDYPEVFARVKHELLSGDADMRLVDIFYNELETVLGNQIQMGNLVK